MNKIPFIPSVTSDIIIDISHYESVNQNFTLVANSGIVAVILKATQGTSFIDPTFFERVTEAQSAGLEVGAYHFLDGSGPADQATHFLTTALSEAGITWLAIDWEPYPQSQANVMQAAAVAAIIYQSSGIWPVLYTIRSMLSSPNKTLSNCPLWLAEYGTRPICPPGFTAWKLWQHTDGQVGSNINPVPGIGFCDRSIFAGSVDQLREWWSNPGG